MALDFDPLATFPVESLDTATAHEAVGVIISLSVLRDKRVQKLIRKTRHATPEQISAMLDRTKGTAERAALLALATSGLRRAASRARLARR